MIPQPLAVCLGVAALLFGLGLLMALLRRNALLALLGVEFMLSAVNINFVAFWRHGGLAASMDGIVFTIFVMAIAAAEVAVGLAMVIALHRHFKTIRLDRINRLHG